MQRKNAGSQLEAISESWEDFGSIERGLESTD